jgi:hypothetical protein
MTQTRTRLGAMQIAIIVLTVATALVHLQRAWLAWGDNDLTTTLMFGANFLGYLALITALYAPIAALAAYRKWIRWALIAFAVVTILGWVAVGAREPIGYIDKVIEIVLVVLLFLESRQQ